MTTQHVIVQAGVKHDINYELARQVIDDVASKLLFGVIKKSVLYKYPQDYILVRDTFYVESFNNVMNIFQDKRICFSDDQYLVRSNLAVLNWNDNVDRKYTSISHPRVPNACM